MRGFSEAPALAVSDHFLICCDPGEAQFARRYGAVQEVNFEQETQNRTDVTLAEAR